MEWFRPFLGRYPVLMHSLLRLTPRQAITEIMRRADAMCATEVAWVPGGEEQHRKSMRTALTLEHYWMFRGVSVYVDKGLLDRVMELDLDVQVSDIRTPFPCCEFVFPDNVEIPGSPGYAFTGVVLFDHTHGVSRNDCLQLCGFPPTIADKFPQRFSIMYQPRMLRGAYSKLHGGTCLVDTDSFAPGEVLHVETLDYAKTVNNCLASAGIDPVESRARDRNVAKCILGLLMYTQMYEALSLTLHDLPHEIEAKRQGIAADVAKTLRRMHPAKRLVNLLSPKNDEERGGSIPTGRVMPAHWRKAHLRALRNEKFHRNADGSIRVILVRAARIHSGDQDALHAVREAKMEAVA